ncbi:PREDICTED: uncharacterized protein LOC105461065 [Wasmannia auropunctata]|uniref:uncharacterized protein LOC105461065 n=1 Tax=Wasmannia auropunctata TaxID=64793 RepID=UPI0005F05DF4|nr:PREDICTED: uncharacterized protein LOC105461065 [Wasmannia auropunctata]
MAVIVEDGLRKGGPSAPIAQKTFLGWILSGVIGESGEHCTTSSFRCAVEDELTAMVRQFWEQEELPCPSVPLTEAERQCEDHFVRTHSRLPTGRYMVRLPTAPALPPLGETRRAATRVLQSMERRFKIDRDLEAKYRDFMKEYEDLGHMEVANASQARRLCSLPHHGVLKQSGDSTKIRVVFNGSARLPSGDSLNDNLLTRPNLLPALPDVLLR